MSTASSAPRGIPPALVTWIGTFLAAASQSSDWNSRARICTVAPCVALPVWLLLSRRQRSAFPAVIASLVTSQVLAPAQVRSVNNVIWLRIANIVWALLSPAQSTLLTQLALCVTFWGVTTKPHLSQPLIVKMTHRFLPPNFFAPPGNRAEPAGDKRERQLTLADAASSFGRAFRGICMYNFSLHYAAAVVNRLVRTLAKAPLPQNLSQTFAQATKEACVLNVAVASSCYMWVAGAVWGGDLAGVVCSSLPLWLCSPRVRNTVYFLFVPWSMRYLSRATGMHDGISPTLKASVGVLLCEGPLRTFADEQTASYAWLISIAFGLAQRVMAGAAGF